VNEQDRLASSVAETERMVKVQEVILKAMAGSLKWWEAAAIIGVTDFGPRHSESKSSTRKPFCQ
jgi:hypothetical protein